MILHKRENRALLQTLRTYFLTIFNPGMREAADVVFSVMVIFMVTCIGSMLLICLFFEMDRRSFTPQPSVQHALPSTSDAPVR